MSGHGKPESLNGSAEDEWKSSATNSDRWRDAAAPCCSCSVAGGAVAWPLERQISRARWRGRGGGRRTRRRWTGPEWHFTLRRVTVPPWHLHLPRSLPLPLDVQPARSAGTSHALASCSDTSWCCACEGSCFRCASPSPAATQVAPEASARGRWRRSGVHGQHSQLHAATGRACMRVSSVEHASTMAEAAAYDRSGRASLP